MEIFGFLFGLGCLVVIVWAMPSAVRFATIALLGHAVFGRKHQQQNQPSGQPSPKPTQFREPRTSQTTTIVPLIPRRKVVTLAKNLYSLSP